MIPDHSGSTGAGTTNTRSIRGTQSALPPGAAMRVSLLGEVALGRGDTGPASVPGARARLLLAALAIHPGRSRSAPALIADVWGEQPPRAPMNALHTQVSRLRSALPDGALEVGPAGYRLALGEDQVDLTLARRLERQAREAHAAGDNDTCLDLVARARALWRGEPGADLPPGPIADELAELAATRWHALDELELASREASGDLDGAVRIARGIAAARSLDEPAHGTLMRLLAAVGRGNEALEVFAAVRARLVSELGADPGSPLVELNAAILRGEPMTTTRPQTPGQRVASAQHAACPDDVASTTATSPAAARPIPAIGLRAAPNPLLGRADDLGALEDLVCASRVTTVLGPGGTGKTRVANELGLRVARELPVALVELASVRADPADPDGARTEIEAAISVALGIGETGRDATILRPGRTLDARQRLRDALAARPMLLVLDNCEHLIDAVAEVVADLVGACDQLSVLTTSRAPLEITAETVYPLPPLTIDAQGSPATELFAARARAIRPSVRLNPEVVARLCGTLDGLPLAIELAAARVRTMSVEEIDARLDHRFTLLRSGDRTSPERHRTLRAVIEWSWNLLDEPQRIALRRLCRYPAGFTLAAAEVAAGGPEVGDVAMAVDGLVGQSLLSVLEDDNGGTRYRMLETVREFGEEQVAASGEADLIMDRIAAWARDFALDSGLRFMTDEQVRVVLSVGTELDNLLAVLRYAVDRRDSTTSYTLFPVLGGLWMIRGAHMELVTWVPRVLALPPPEPVQPDANLQVAAYLLLGLHSMFGPRDLRTIATIRLRIRRLLRSGVSLAPLSRFASELITISPPTVHQGSRKLAEGVRSRDRDTRAAALMLRANLRENASDIYGSMRDALRVMECLDAGDVWGRAMVSQHLAQLSAQSANYRESVENYRRATHALYQLRSYDEGVEIRSFLAGSLVGAGELIQARQELEIAAGFVEDAAGPDDPVLRPNHRRAAVQLGWAELALAEGDIEAGLRRSRRVLELYAWPELNMAPGPGIALSAACVLDAHILHDRLGEVPDLPRQLAAYAAEQLAQFWDLPQVGAVGCAIGSYLLAVDRNPDQARELLALAPKVVARQDYPSLVINRHLALHGAATDEPAMAEPRRAIARMSRRAAARRIMVMLRDIGERLHE